MRLTLHSILASGILFVLWLAVPGAAVADVLICGAADDPRRLDVQAKVQATGLISGSVDDFDARTATPTLAQLQAYSAVLVFCNNAPADTVALGHVLADYVDDGGTVVIATFALNNTSIGVEGRFRTADYSPLAFGAQTSNVQYSLGTVHDTSHPLVQGVSSFDGGSASFHNDTSLTPGATLVAEWSHGAPLIAVHDIGNGSVVALNMYPPSADVVASFWNPSTDGAVIMANALNYGGGGGGGGGGSAAEIRVERVVGNPISHGGTDPLGEKEADVSELVTYIIHNDGTANLILTGMPAISAQTNCTVTLTNAPTSPVTPGNSTSFSVSVMPLDEGPFSADITITNNDPDFGSFLFTQTGTGLVDEDDNGGSGGGGGAPSSGGGCALPGNGHGTPATMLGLMLFTLAIAAMLRRRG